MTSSTCGGYWMSKMAMTEEAEIDWSLTTWEGVRREQLRRYLRLGLTERLQALDELAKLPASGANRTERSSDRRGAGGRFLEGLTAVLLQA